MALIWDGTKTFELNEGDSVAGWTLSKIELRSKEYIFGAHAFVFEKDGQIRRIVNEQWEGERPICTDTLLNQMECPRELRVFAWRTTKVISEQHRQAVRTGD